MIGSKFAKEEKIINMQQRNRISYSNKNSFFAKCKKFYNDQEMKQIVSYLDKK